MKTAHIYGLGDLWILNFANGEVWEVPLAAIQGG